MRWAAVLLAWLLASAAAAQDVSPVVHSGVVEAGVGDVWRAWATADGLRAWMAPLAAIELRIGGIIRTSANAKGRLGDVDTLESTVLAYEPLRMLATRVTKPPAGFPYPQGVQRLWTVVYVDPIGPLNTRVRLVTLGFDGSEESEKLRAFFQQGNAAVLSQLQKHFGAVPRVKSE